MTGFSKTFLFVQFKYFLSYGVRIEVGTSRFNGPCHWKLREGASHHIRTYL